MIGQSLGQTKIAGFVSDSASATGIEFASIGILGKALGTLSNEKGNFEFTFTNDLLKDTLRVSAIGYRPVSFLVSDFIKLASHNVALAFQATELEEVSVKSKKIKYDYLGNTKYTKNNCSGFIKNNSNWKGSEAAILAGNKVGRTVTIESFAFYVIQNKYPDSLKFRLMFYEASDKKFPRYKTFLRKPLVFKMGTKQGEFILDLKNYNIVTSKDFFISLECLEDEMDITKFCYAGSTDTHSFVKPSAFARWNKVWRGGGDFNVKVSYVK